RRANDPADTPVWAAENLHALHSARKLPPPGPLPESAPHADSPAARRQRTIPDAAAAPPAARRNPVPKIHPCSGWSPGVAEWWSAGIRRQRLRTLVEDCPLPTARL